MQPICHLLPALFLLAGLFIAPTPARAAQSYDNCTGYVDTLPATISTQGTWCLRQDVTTGITFGNAITINTNNVTLDCNDFKVGGLQAGVGTTTNGIYANNRLNATVRHCNVRGFFWGVNLSGSGGGHLVEDNRFDGNTFGGIYVSGDGSTVRRNFVYNTGGATSGGSWTEAILSSGDSDVIDNTIWGMTPITTRNDTEGLTIDSNNDGLVAGNRVRGLAGTFNLGIRLYSAANRVRVVDNSFDATQWAIYCDDVNGGIYKNNIVSRGSVAPNCLDLGGNSVVP